MEVTVVETGNLPADTIISFHAGSMRRQAQVEKNKAICLSCNSASDPVRVDLMSQIGSHTFDMVPGQEIYEVPIGDEGRAVRLKVQIREAPELARGDGAEVSASSGAGMGGGGGFGPASPNVASGDASDLVAGLSGPSSPSRKLQSALSMRSYLDTHDVLRNVQDMLEDMVVNRPDDPLEFMIKRLEEVCGDDADEEPAPASTAALVAAAIADGNVTAIAGVPADAAADSLGAEIGPAKAVKPPPQAPPVEPEPSN